MYTTIFKRVLFRFIKLLIFSKQYPLDLSNGEKGGKRNIIFSCSDYYYFQKNTLFNFSDDYYFQKSTLFNFLKE